MDKTILNDTFIIIIMLLIFISGFFEGYVYYSKYEHDIIFNQLKKDIEKKNLKLLDEQTITGKYYSDYDLNIYYSYMKKNYFYEKEHFNCKYWSLNLATYLQKHNLNYKFITFPNHILVMTYNESEYCFYDGDINNCITLINS